MKIVLGNTLKSISTNETNGLLARNTSTYIIKVKELPEGCYEKR